MEEKIQLIKNNLTGDFSEDIKFLNSLYDEENRIIEDAKTTIEAINIVVEEIKKEQETKEENEVVDEQIEEQSERSAQEQEIDNMITVLLEHINTESDDEAIKSIEEILPKVESLTKSDDSIIYCSFKSEFEKILFERIFAGEKEVRTTPYENDVLYITYAELLLKKKRRTEAMEALERAIYWNFLNREAREKKLDIFFSKKEIVKYLESLKLLQMISYTPQDIASCYNKYGFIFNHLKDTKAAYAMYRLSYSFAEDENVADIISKYEELDSTLKSMNSEEILKIAHDNEVLIGANSKIIKAERSIIAELIENGMIEQAKIMLQNDYAMTSDDEIVHVYSKLTELERQDDVQEEIEQKQVEDKEIKKETKKKKESTEKKVPAKRKAATKKASTKKTKEADKKQESDLNNESEPKSK